MNSFGRLFRVHIFGESHGESVGIIVDGCPAGIILNSQQIASDLDKRKGGTQKGTTPRKETDIPIFKSGVFNNTTTGSPIAIFFENNNARSTDYEQIKNISRPGHADFVAQTKFHGFNDYRGGGHFSARLTTGIVTAGTIAKHIISSFHPEVFIDAKIIEIAGVTDVERGVQIAIDNKDTVGGIVECCVKNLPIGLGEPFFDSVESLISHAMFSIPAIKGVEFGSGFQSARMYGSKHNDSIINKDGKTLTNNSGGINGGLTNGNDLLFRIAIKPASSTPKQQKSWNQTTQTVEQFSVKGRHDLCIPLRVPIIVESMTAIVLTDLLLIDKSIKSINNERAY